MNTDDLLTAFRSTVPFPDEPTVRRAYEQAAYGRRRLPRRRLAVAVVVLGAALAGGLYASLGGASSNVNPERQHIVDRAMTHVQQTFGGHLILKATLDGSLLTVDVKADEPKHSVVGPFEGLVLAHVANDRLRRAGYEGVETISISGSGGGALSPLPALPQLQPGACDIPAGTKLANVSAASVRTIPLLSGFCAIRLTTTDPKTLAADMEETLNQLFAAVPVAKNSNGRGVVIEADDEKGVPVIVAAWGPSTDQGGAVYVRPGLCTPLVTPPLTLGGKKRC